MAERPGMMGDKDGLKQEREAGAQGRSGVTPAGPHAAPELTDKDKTPGSGMLPAAGDAQDAPTG